MLIKRIGQTDVRLFQSLRLIYPPNNHQFEIGIYLKNNNKRND